MTVEIIRAWEDNYMFLVSGRDGVFVVDPTEAESVIEAATTLHVPVVAALLTHHHNDHTDGCDMLASDTSCLIVGPDDPRMPTVTKRVSGGDEISLGGVRVCVIATPGHTSSHVVYHVPREKLLFTGDTLFCGGCGRLFEGTAEQMWESMVTLRNLPADTLVYCGHEYTVGNLEFAHHLQPDNRHVSARLADAKAARTKGLPTVPSRLSDEMATNAFMRADDPQVAQSVGLASASPVQVFAELRRRKDSW